MINTKDKTELAARIVELTDQLASRITFGFPVAPEDLTEAEALGIDVQAMIGLVDDCYVEADDYEDI